MMNRSLVIAILGLGLTFTAVPASAVVYCKTVGVPKGCVARPVTAPASAVVYCTGAGVPKGCVARPAAGGNANGGVNRVGPLR
jgi:hypothetical protein